MLENKGRFVNAQNSITHDEFSNFLRAGAIWRRQGIWYLLLGLEKSTEEVHNNHVITISYKDFYGNKSVTFVPSKVCQMTGTELELRLNSLLMNDTMLKINNWEEANEASFAESFSQIQTAISQGILKKAVPIVFTKTTWRPSEKDLAKMIFHLFKSPEHLTIYGIWNSDGGVLGASPEVLIELENHTLSTMALAGTLPKKQFQANDISIEAAEKKLLLDQKELSEHEFVVNDLLTQLNQLGQPLKNGPYVVELPTLYHLRTDFEYQVDRQIDFNQLIQKLHPTPALGTYPRHLWNSWLKDLPEQKHRGTFGAPFTLQMLNWKSSIVGIRNIEWSKNGSRIGSGCGIVADSDLQKEWYELKQKRESVKRLLGIH